MGGYDAEMVQLVAGDEEEHQNLVSRMIAGAEGAAGLLHKITKPTSWRGGVQVQEEEDRCQAFGQVCGGEERAGEALAVQHGDAKSGGQAVED